MTTYRRVSIPPAYITKTSGVPYHEAPTIGTKVVAITIPTVARFLDDPGGTYSEDVKHLF